MNAARRGSGGQGDVTGFPFELGLSRDEVRRQRVLPARRVLCTWLERFPLVRSTPTMVPLRRRCHGALLEDLRTRVLRDADAGLPSKDIAVKYAVSRAWVDRVKQRRRETGEVTPRKQTTFRGRTLSPDEEVRLVALITVQPDATLAELRARCRRGRRSVRCGARSVGVASG